MIDILNFVGSWLMKGGFYILYAITWVCLVKLSLRCAVEGGIAAAGVCFAFLLFLTGWGILNVVV